jgi:hypothetical protein
MLITCLRVSNPFLRHSPLTTDAVVVGAHVALIEATRKAILKQACYAFGYIIVAFCCAPQAYADYNDIINPSLGRLTRATGLSIVVVTAYYLTIALP